MVVPVEDADNVSADCTGRQLQNDLLSPAQRTLRRQACGVCHVIPRYPYTKPLAQQLVLPEEFNNSW